MKRTSVKVLISASIILAMIPFSFNNVAAYETGVPRFYYTYSFETNGGNTAVMDIYYYSYNPISTNSDTSTTWPSINVNPQYTVTPTTNYSWSYLIIDAEGLVNYSVETQSSGSTMRYKFYFKLENCTYFHFQIKIKSSYWTSSTMPNVSNALNPSTSSGTYTRNPNYTANTNEILYKIYTALSNGGAGGVDLSGVITLLNDIYDCNLASNANEEIIINKLDSIISLLETQPDSPAEDSINDNTTANENLQTEQENYEQLEQQFNSDFSDNLDDISVSDWSTRLTGWSTGVTWLKTQMNTMFNSMGDYKYMLEIGMILAIALIFIGR